MSAFFRLIHSLEFKKGLDDYTFLNTSYPWEVFTGSFYELGNQKFHHNRALLLEDEQYDRSLFESDLGKKPLNL